MPSSSIRPVTCIIPRDCWTAHGRSGNEAGIGIAFERSDGSEAEMKVPEIMVSRTLVWVAVAASIGLAACTSGSSNGSGAVTIAGDVPIAYAKRANTVTLNPLTGGPFAPGGDLMIREKASPSAPEHNITAQYTQGKGDVTDPQVSYDGTRIVFAMN